MPAQPGGARSGGETSQLRLFDRVDEATSVTRRLARDEAVRDFQAYLKELPAEDQDLVLHVGIEGLTNAEAARRLGISPDAATKRWQRLRAHLRASRAAARLLED
jgi:RNA polymerase sigma factor (sigma-70 family)